jgi:hypothetical protein
MGSPPSGRPLDRAEERVLRHLLSAWPQGAPYVRRLGSMRVVGSCSCGCVTVDLSDEQAADLDQPSRPLPVEGDLLSEAGEYMGGVLLFTRSDGLTMLEAYSMADELIMAWPPNDRIIVRFRDE